MAGFFFWTFEQRTLSDGYTKGLVLLFFSKLEVPQSTEKPSVKIFIMCDP